MLECPCFTNLCASFKEISLNASHIHFHDGSHEWYHASFVERYHSLCLIKENPTPSVILTSFQFCTALAI